MAAFQGMHVSPAKHSYAWLPRKCDRQTRKCDRQTHRWTERRHTKWSLCAAMLRRQHKNGEHNSNQIGTYHFGSFLSQVIPELWGCHIIGNLKRDLLDCRPYVKTGRETKSLKRHVCNKMCLWGTVNLVATKSPKAINSFTANVAVPRRHSRLTMSPIGDSDTHYLEGMQRHTLKFPDSKYNMFKC